MFSHFFCIQHAVWLGFHACRLHNLNLEEGQVQHKFQWWLFTPICVFPKQFSILLRWGRFLALMNFFSSGGEFATPHKQQS